MFRLRDFAIVKVIGTVRSTLNKYIGNTGIIPAGIPNSRERLLIFPMGKKYLSHWAGGHTASRNYRRC